MTDITSLASALRLLPYVRLAVLFGSRARRTARQDSDVDLAIELEPDSMASRAEAAQQITGAVDTPVDLVFLNDADPPWWRRVTHWQPSRTS